MDTNPGDSDPGNLKADQYSAPKEREGGVRKYVGVVPTTLTVPPHPDLMFDRYPAEYTAATPNGLRICASIIW